MPPVANPSKQTTPEAAPELAPAAEHQRSFMDAFRRSKPARVAAGIAVVIGAALAGNTLSQNLGSVESAEAAMAQASAKKPMKPEAVIKAINRIVGQSHGSGGPFLKRKYGMDIRSAILTPTKSSFKGKCDPKNKYDPGIKRATVKNGKSSMAYCFGGSDTTRIPILRQYSPAMNRLGTKAFNSAGLVDTTHGTTTRISATRAKATIRFAKNTASTEKQQLKSLTLRVAKPPVPRWYKR